MTSLVFIPRVLRWANSSAVGFENCLLTVWVIFNDLSVNLLNIDLIKIICSIILMVETTDRKCKTFTLFSLI